MMLHETRLPAMSQWQTVQLAVLRSFTESHGELDVAFRLSPPAWRRLLHWLDVSGLALYFLAHLRELGLASRIPSAVYERLQQNLKDNAERMRVMAEEDMALQAEFQSQGLEYVVLKGFSLQPYSVPSFKLRSQLDLDFLIAPQSLGPAQAIMERRGYHLRGQSGRSWEYKDEPVPRTSIKQLYLELGSRSVELHVANTPVARAQLSRCEFAMIHGVPMPVLSPVDLFLGQALHLYKHVAADGARASHVLELYRHILGRREDIAFWVSLREFTSEDGAARFALGFVVALITHAMGDFAPEALASWTADALPEFAHRWIDRFGLAAALGSDRGSKLSMILQDELEAHGLGTRTSARGRLIPTRLPPRIEQPAKGETLAGSIGRNARQLRYILHRLRFHLVEGVRLEIERARWKATQKSPQQTNDNPLTHP